MGTKPVSFPEKEKNLTCSNPATISPGTSHLKLALPQPGMLGTYEDTPVGTNFMNSSQWTETGASSQKL